MYSYKYSDRNRQIYNILYINKEYFMTKFKIIVRQLLNPKEIIMVSELSKEQMKTIFDKYMVLDFPKSELKPWKKIEDGLLHGSYFAYGMFEDTAGIGNDSAADDNSGVDGLVAYAFFIRSNKYNTYLLDYLAVLKEKRQSGAGSVFLQQLKRIAINDGMELILEVENPDYEQNPTSQDNMRKRIQFYKKNLMNVSDVSCNFMNNEYKILFATDGRDNDDIRELTENVYRDFFGDSLVDNNVIFHDIV